jgi:Rap1a immunity proteins
MKSVLATFFLLAMSAPILAQESDVSGNAMLRSCKALIDGGPSTNCLGMILEIGTWQPRIFCPPPNGSSTQWARVIVVYVEARPERLNEDFKILALAALRDAWPCPNTSPNSN